MRAKITDHTESKGLGYVTLTYANAYTGETVYREFMLPFGRSYVLEYRNGEWRQVCDNLSDMGCTLICYDPARLAALIRTHYHRMRAIERRDPRAFCW